jgi:hypothetical protein
VRNVGRDRRAFDKEHKEVGTQTERIEDKVERRKQSEVGTQTDAMLSEMVVAKRKEISPIVEMQGKRKKPRQSIARMPKRALVKAVKATIVGVLDLQMTSAY